MASSSASLEVVRFAKFEANLRSRELRRDGASVRLPDQSFEVLAMLLERPGELVAREEFRKRLWSADTFVDFDHGLNNAVNRLRDALEDSAESPRFVETLPRRGYRFIGTDEGTPQDSGDQTLPVRRNGFRRAAYVSAALVLLICICGLLISLNLPHLPKVTTVVQLTNDAVPKLPMNKVVTDGVHLYFLEGSPWTGGSRIAQVSLVGGETTPLATPLREIRAIGDISPDFSELLVESGPGEWAGVGLEVWAQPLPAGTPHRVGSIHATSACYTRDGLHILYADGRALNLIDRDGTNPRELTKIQGQVQGIRYSPDGKRIRFHTVDWSFNNASLWEIDATGKGLHPLLPNWKESPFQCCGSWSPDGKYYFFQAGRGNDQAIWVMPEHQFILSISGGPTRLISGPLRLSTPVPATDGRKLFVKGAQFRVEPVHYDATTHRFEPYLNDMSLTTFEYSRDRKWIAYVSYPDMSLWRSRADGTDKMQLTFPPVRVYGPRWSPDGSRIAYTDVRYDRPWEVSLISGSGGPPRSLPSAAPGAMDPNWMPDEKSIVYAKPINPSIPDTEQTAAIFRQDLDTGRITLLPNSEARFSPRVSPDGRYVAAFSQDSSELLLFDSRRNHWSTLAKGEFFSYNLWSDDGKYIYMRDQHAGSPRIVRVRVADAKMEEVVSLKDLPQLVDAFTGWFGLTPDGDPVVIRDRSTQEIYALDLR